MSNDGSAAAVELDVFQYAFAASQIPSLPHRFRGLWAFPNTASSLQGEWYLCPDNSEPPRLVGDFEASPDGSDLSPAPLTASSIVVPAATRTSLMSALDAQPMSLRREKPVLSQYAVDGITSVQYIPEWIGPEQEAQFLHLADGGGGLSPWEAMRTRSTQEWGAGNRCSCGRGLVREPLPPWQQELADALHHIGVFDGSLYPMNSVRINSYNPGQGIHPHCDGPVYYPKVAILSMGSTCIFNFYPRSGTEDCMKWDQANDVPGGHIAGDVPEVSLLLEPRSLLIFDQDAFWHHRHGFDATAVDELKDTICNFQATSYKPGESVQRTRRVSLTMRHLLPRCNCAYFGG